MIKFRLKYLIYPICIILNIGQICAVIQPGDTLMDELAKVTQSEKVSYLLNVLESNPQLASNKAITYAEEGLQWALELKNDEDLAKTYNYLGNKYYLIGNYDQSLVNYQDALRITLRIGKKEEVAVLMQKLGIVNFNKSDYKKSLLYFQQTLKIFQELGYSIREAELYNSMGSIFFHWEEYEKAMENYEFAYNIYKELDHLPSLANVLYLKGLTSQKLKRFDKAIYWFNQSISVHEKLNNQNDIAKTNNSIGETYMLMREFDLALSQFVKAYKIHEKISDRIIIAQSLNNLGNVYKEMGEFKKSAQYLNQSNGIAKELDLKLTMIDNYKSYYELYYLQNMSKEALKYYQLYVNLRDSIFDSKQNVKKVEAHNTSINEEVLNLKKELFEKVRFYKLLNIFSIVIIALLVLFVFYQRRKFKIGQKLLIP